MDPRTFAICAIGTLAIAPLLIWLLYLSFEIAGCDRRIDDAFAGLREVTCLEGEMLLRFRNNPSPPP